MRFPSVLSKKARKYMAYIIAAITAILIIQWIIENWLLIVGIIIELAVMLYIVKKIIDKFFSWLDRPKHYESIDYVEYWDEYEEREYIDEYGNKRSYYRKTPNVPHYFSLEGPRR